MILSSRQFPGAGYDAAIRLLVAGVVLVLVLQGAHVCPPAGSAAAGVQASFSGASPICPLCALAHTFLLILLLVLFSLLPNHVRTPLLSRHVRPYLRGLRMDLRGPPVL
jgi:hypothetical protein